MDWVTFGVSLSGALIGGGLAGAATSAILVRRLTARDHTTHNPVRDSIASLFEKGRRPTPSRPPAASAPATAPQHEVRAASQVPPAPTEALLQMNDLAAQPSSPQSPASSADQHLARGNSYFLSREYDKAIMEYSLALQEQPNCPEAYYNRGVAYSGKGDHRQAIEDFTFAIKYKPDYARAYNNRGSSYGELKDYDQAIADFNHALRLQPNFPEAYYNRGRVYYRKGEYHRALEDFNRALSLNPNFSRAYYTRACLCAKEGRFEECYSSLEKAISLAPELLEPARTDPDLEQVRQEPRLRALLKLG